MASAELSRRVGKVVGYPPLSEMAAGGAPGPPSSRTGLGAVEPVVVGHPNPA
jgi:hypothetical protein